MPSLTYRRQLGLSCVSEIWVAKGIYKPTSTTDRNVGFAMKNSVAIYGGFAGDETSLSARNWSANPTILSGEIGDPSSTTDNSYHVISNSPSILDGFIITAGNANNGSGFTWMGGGMLNNASSPLIRNCVFRNNIAIGGAALANIGYGGSGSPVLINCSFQNNTAGEGGAIYSFCATGNTIKMQLTNCSFQENSAPTGGAITNSSGAGSSSQAQLINCVFWNNGGANTFYGSESGVGSSPNITATYSLFDNTVTGYSSSPTNLTTATSPFASISSTQLVTNSSAINAGDPATTSATVGITDLAGNPRFGCGRIDMGAYEFQGRAPTLRAYVNASATGANNGLTWTDAFTDLQVALNQACIGEIWVARGTYKPTSTTNRDASFAMMNGLAIYGGFAGGETSLSARNWSANPTILSGEIGNPSVTTDNSYHVITNAVGITTTAILDGFIITAGNANGAGVESSGGGMYNYSCSPQVRNCIYRTNTATNGGAICNHSDYAGNSNPQLTNCTFQSNTATSGGAIYAENSGGTGGASFLKCTFQGNVATTGGAMTEFNAGGKGNAVFTNCLFQTNIATANGGVLYVFAGNGQSFLQLTNSVFQRNKATKGGAIYTTSNSAGIASPQVTNCSFQSNTATTAGGAIANNSSNQGTSKPQVTNCVFWNNGGISTFDNYANAASDVSSVSATYSLFDNTVTGYSSSPTNLTTVISPFASTSSAQLAANSVASDTGDPTTTSATVGTTDLLGNPRFVNSRIDLGAYEFQGPILIYTLKNGSWNDPTVWSVNRLPLSGDIVQLRHLVQLPVSYIATCTQVRFETGGRLNYGTMARLQIGQ